MVHEKTEVKRLDQAHTVKHVKSQAETQGFSYRPSLVGTQGPQVEKTGANVREAF